MRSGARLITTSRSSTGLPAGVLFPTLPSLSAASTEPAVAAGTCQNLFAIGQKQKRGSSTVISHTTDAAFVLDSSRGGGGFAGYGLSWPDPCNCPGL